MRDEELICAICCGPILITESECYDNWHDGPMHMECRRREINALLGPEEPEAD